MLKTLAQGLDALYSLVYPNLCASCMEELTGNEELICIVCWQEVIPTRFHTYSMNDVARKLYGRFYFNRAAAGYYFHKVSGLQTMLHAVKYREQAALGIELGKRLARTCMSNQWLDQLDYIVPIPLSDKKFRERGFNQAELLAKGIQQIVPIPLDTQSLIRNRNTETQTKKNIAQRQKNVANAFEVVQPQTFRNKHVLLLDDVLTTGATIASCAKEILKIPGAEVSVLTLAYAVEE